ncbi:hypothetical protein HPP92_002699 [Vanilla planifolia]|uniref:Uncharacterized protein n=1 Tax=Vanilla planifolia TaxID=51239 RepID=A0A835VI76_VANPL|nr:hypothetical protein HPP92_002699 [Vanilla planifolia]
MARCGGRAAALLILATAIPVALIASLERRATAVPGSLSYRSGGFIRETAKWDPPRRRFLISTFFDGGVAEIRLPGGRESADIVEREVVTDADVAGNASLGIAVDLKRDRFLVVYADLLHFRSAALASYDLQSGQRIFLTSLCGPDDELSFADDVAVDEVGNAYVTDATANKLWKVGSNGELLSVIRSSVFAQKKGWHRNFVGLNGIVCHPNGYLLVVHTAGGYLFKVDTLTEEVSLVQVTGSLLLGDGMELLSPTKLVVAGTPTARVVESSDDWKTAKVTAKLVGPLHRMAASVTVKEGKVYISHLLGLGFRRRTHVLVEADFTVASRPGGKKRQRGGCRNARSSLRGYCFLDFNRGGYVEHHWTFGKLRIFLGFSQDYLKLNALTVAEERSWSLAKASRHSGDLSLTLMDKTQKLSRGYGSSYVPDYRHAAEAVGESEGFCSPAHVGSETSCTPKRRCISLNADRCDGFYVPMEVVTLAKLSSSARKNLEARLRRDLEKVQKFQKKIIPSNAIKSNGVALSSSTDPLVKKQDLAAQNVSLLKHGVSGALESKKHAVTPSVALLMKQCETLLKRLMGHQYAWVFNSPVDVVKLNIPDYFTVIKQPMDLGTVQSKIASGVYSSPLDFAFDVRLTFNNAMTYNPPENGVHVMADVMRKFFETRWKAIEKKLISTDLAVKRVSSKQVPQPKKRKIPLDDHSTIMLDYKPMQKMSDDEKLSLSRHLSLIPELPHHIVDFLKRHTDNTSQNCEDELEIDFDSLGDDTLFELKKLLDQCLKDNCLEKPAKTDNCEIEILNESGLSSSSMHPCKVNERVDEEEDEYVDIGGNDPPTTRYSPIERLNVSGQRSSLGNSSCSSSSKSRSSSSDTESGSTFRSKSNIQVAVSPNSTKEQGYQAAPSYEKGLVNGVEKLEQGSNPKAESLKPNGSQEGENAPSDRQVSPDKLYRAALLRSRFADTILKAREKTLDQGEKKDPEKLRREREELERQQREERARLQAEAKAAEDARRRAEEEAAAEAKRKRELEREAARQALLQMEKTVVIHEGSVCLKDCSNEGIDEFKLGGSNPLEQLGLYIKADGDEEEEGDEPCNVLVNDVEEGEVD